ncbi:unnamed protein product [Brassica oleracea]|uniref:(rape) hypothetical protein n=1 Tax=Brassica napus TaxID=3708 RepID=A0A816KG67_BRANA|nr:unnamed protein product [Brassica napus]
MTSYCREPKYISLLLEDYFDCLYNSKEISPILDSTHTEGVIGIKQQIEEIHHHLQKWNCNHCSELLSELALPDIDNLEMPNLSKLENILENEAPRQEMWDISPVHGGTLSWLRKCTSKILKLSPIKMAETTATLSFTDQETQSAEQANVNSGPSTMLQVQSESDIIEVEVANANSDGDHSKINSKAQEVDVDSLSIIAADGLSRMRGKARVRRTRSVKAVVEDAKTIYRESIQLNEPVDLTENVEDTAKGNDKSTGEPGRSEKGDSKNGRKRERMGS